MPTPPVTLREAGLEPELRDGAADETGFAVGAHGGDDSHGVARREEPPGVGREVQRDSPRPIAAEADIAVDAAIAHGSDSHRGGSYTLIT
jgi:hypothetical protein